MLSSLAWHLVPENSPYAYKLLRVDYLEWQQEMKSKVTILNDMIYANLKIALRHARATLEWLVVSFNSAEVHA